MTTKLLIDRELLRQYCERVERGAMDEDHERYYAAEFRQLLATPPADAADMGGQAGEEVEVRGLQWLDTGHYRKKPPQFGYNPHDWNPLMTVAQHRRILAQHRQQAGKLVEALSKIHFRADCFVEDDMDMRAPSIEAIVRIAGEALADLEKAK